MNIHFFRLDWIESFGNISEFSFQSIDRGSLEKFRACMDIRVHKNENKIILSNRHDFSIRDEQIKILQLYKMESPSDQESRKKRKKLSPETKKMVDITKERLKTIQNPNTPPPLIFEKEEEISTSLPEYTRLSESQKKRKIPEKPYTKTKEEEKIALESLETYLASKSNQTIASYKELKNMIKNIITFYKLSIDDSKIDSVVDKFTNLLIESNQDFYLKYSFDLKAKKNVANVIYRKNIDSLNKIIISENKLKNILEQELGIKTFTSKALVDFSLFDASFPFYQMTSVFINSSSLFFSYSIEQSTGSGSGSNRNIIFYNVSSNFERTRFGMILYAQYFTKKYSKKLCDMVTDDYKQIFSEAKLLDKKISEFYTKFSDYGDKLYKTKGENEQKKLFDAFWNQENISFFNNHLYNIRLYVSKVNELINCNWYVFSLFQALSINKETNTEMVYDDSKPKYERLEVSNILKEKILNCLRYNKDFILIPFTIKKKEWKDENHQNILIVDVKRNLVERFEPHGTASVKKDEDINSELWYFFHKIRLDYQYDLCSVSSIQQFEWEIPKELTGKCVSLSYGYLDHRLNEIYESSGKKSVLSAEFAPISYYNLASEKGIIHWYDINVLNFHLFLEMQKYLDDINDYFKSCLVFRGNVLSFYEKSDYFPDRCNCNE
jgi:hypothetical protein